MLRIVSFCLDYHASLRPDHDPRSPSPRSTDYTPTAFVAYALYPPLYIAGPIMLFDEFYAQLREPPTITRANLTSYATRFVVCVLTMEWILHNIFVVAIKNTHAWHGLSPSELSMIGFWNLIVIWLKVCRLTFRCEFLVKNVDSCSYLGASSAYGRWRIASTRPRT